MVVYYYSLPLSPSIPCFSLYYFSPPPVPSLFQGEGYKGPVFYKAKFDDTADLSRLQDQFLYVELTSIEEEMKTMGYQEKLPRSCYDLKVLQV